MKLLSNWRFWVGCTISLLCLWLALHHVPLAEVGHLVARANRLWLLLAVAFQLSGVLARAQRWVVLLSNKTQLTDSFWSQGVGYLFTNIFPLRMGEPARVFIMAQRSGLPLMQVAASAIVERMLDVATVVLVLVLVLPWMNVPPLVKRTGIILGALSLAANILLLLAVRFGSQSERVLKYVCNRIRFLPTEAIVGRWRELIIGFTPLTQPKLALQGIGWALAAWAASITTYWCVLRAFQHDASIVEASFMVVALAFAVTVPSSPGFLGVFQLVGQQALVLPFGAKYGPTSAMAITMAGYLIYYLLTTVLGIIGLWQFGESFANVGRMLSPKKADP
jgi:uncharacterized protein (TIRG00374 family)